MSAESLARQPDDAQPARHAVAVARARTREATPVGSHDARTLPADQLVHLTDLIAELLRAPRGLVDAVEAAKLLGVKPGWVLANARRGVIPHVKLGRYPRFDPEALWAWAKVRETGPSKADAGSRPVSPRRKRR